MTAIETILQYLDSFLEGFLGILGQSLPQEAISGIVTLFCLGVVIRLIDVGPRIPRKIYDRVTKKDEDEEWVLVRRKVK